MTWLRTGGKLIEFGEWTPPTSRAHTREDKQRTVGEWLKQWLILQEGELAASTTLKEKACSTLRPARGPTVTPGRY